MRLTRTQVLSQSEIEQVNEVALKILEEVGLEIHGDRILKILSNGGANVDFGTKRVRFPRKLVEECLLTVPSKIPWYDRDGNLTAVLGSGKPYVAMGHNAVFMQDIDTGERRYATVKDVEQLTIVADRLDQIDIVGIPVDPWEVPPEAHVIYGVKALMENTTKPVYFSSNIPEVNVALYEMAKVVYDGDLAKKPYIVTQHSPTSPLFIEESMAESLYEMAIRGIPVCSLPEPYNGVSAPYTVAGLLASCTAEILSGIVMAQIFNPGVYCLYGSSWTTFDMRHGAALIGSPETNLLRIAHAQMGKFYNIPCHVTSPNTEAHDHDEQMAWEKMMSQYACMTSGNDFIVNCGMFSTGLTFSLEQLVLDNEMVGIIRRMMEGIKVDEDTLAFDV
ncbi:MAG TPA: hypothetical protein GXX14_05915, partial [Clostridiaceae bacterium]|nr:hypothetical protein [Clostridiaceae bacterium]